MDTYKTIASPCEGVFTEKRSKFIAMAFPVTTLEQIKEHLAGCSECRKEYESFQNTGRLDVLYTSANVLSSKPVA